MSDTIWAPSQQQLTQRPPHPGQWIEQQDAVDVEKEMHECYLHSGGHRVGVRGEGRDHSRGGSAQVRTQG